MSMEKATTGSKLTRDEFSEAVDDVSQKLLEKLMDWDIQGGVCVASTMKLLAHLLVRIPDSPEEYKDWLERAPSTIHAYAQEIALGEVSKDMLDGIVKEHYNS